MTQAEVTRNFAAVLEKIQQGAEVVVQRDLRPVAVIRPPKRSGRRSRSASLRPKPRARKRHSMTASPPMWKKESGTDGRFTHKKPKTGDIVEFKANVQYR
jgi:antitoxin (DNA-binding transcriptional repressor) of toxin-antitoxin stability system